jgi:hypothetical protein
MRIGVKIMSRMQSGFFLDATPHILHIVTADCEKFNKRDNRRIYNIILWHLGTILIPPRLSKYSENKSV